MVIDNTSSLTLKFVQDSGDIPVINMPTSDSIAEAAAKAAEEAWNSTAATLPPKWRSGLVEGVDVFNTSSGIEITVTNQTHLAEKFEGSDISFCTFRTEFSADFKGAMALIKELNLILLQHWCESDYHDNLHFFTVLAPVSVEELRTQMHDLIEVSGRNAYADLHRCYQTLSEGDSPKDPF